MDGWLHPLLRFAHYALLLGLFGLAAFRAVGLRRLAGVVPIDGPPAGLLRVGLLLALTVSAALMWVEVAAMMGQPPQAVELGMFSMMVTSTSIGWAFAVRVALLASAALAALVLPRRQRSASVAVLLGGALCTLPWSGHAAATEGVAGTVHRLSDALHLLAAGLWIGAISWFAWLTARVHRRDDAGMAGALLAAMHRFAPLGMILVAIVAATGIVNAQLIFSLPNTAAVLGTPYGALLAAKVALVALMLGCGARNAWLSRRGVAASTGVATLPTLRRSLSAELLLAALVLGSVAALGTLSPME